MARTTLALGVVAALAGGAAAFRPSPALTMKVVDPTPNYYSTGRSSPSTPSTVAKAAASDLVTPTAGRVKQPLSYRVADKVVGTLFAIDPLFNTISKKARASIKSRADKLGFSWEAYVDRYKQDMENLEAEYEKVNRPDSVILPAYYQKPFHAYKEGNLGWAPAMEVEAAAYAVHSPIYTGSTKDLEKEGDSKLRGNFHDRMLSMIKEYDFKPKRILDVGCSTGLSTLKLSETFPDAEIMGVDLSPYMLAVASYNLKFRPEFSGARGRVEYVHAAGEATGLPDKDVDMVSICLVNHELPNSAARAVFREAHRVLRPGGCLSFMDMNPGSPSFLRLINNPLLFALFKSTEPWLQEYVTLDLEAELRAAGFSKVEMRENSPRHRTLVAFK